jgi:signal recognition particle subunit SRP54
VLNLSQPGKGTRHWREVSKALNPAQQVITIVNEELIQTLGMPTSEPESEKPYVVMLWVYKAPARLPPRQNMPRYCERAGTRAAVAADIYRPAAISNCRPLARS